MANQTNRTAIPNNLQLFAHLVVKKGQDRHLTDFGQILGILLEILETSDPILTRIRSGSVVTSKVFIFIRILHHLPAADITLTDGLAWSIIHLYLRQLTRLKDY